MKKLLLIDGSNLIFRAYYATEANPIKNLDGVYVNAVYTLISMIDKLIKDEKPTHVYIAMDSGSETFRHKLYEGYKGTRVSAPEKLKYQFPIIKEYFSSLGVEYGEEVSYEADDLIASYANIAKNEGYLVKVVSGDKDLLQLVDDNVEVFSPKNGFAKECNYTNEVFFEKYGFKPDRFNEYKALVGDSSDNIIGVEKLGDKTAKKLIIGSSSIEEIFEQAKSGEIKGKLGQRLVECEDLVYKNMHLIKLVEDMELKIPLDTLSFSGYDIDKYGDFLKEQGFIKKYKDFLKSNDQEVVDANIKYEVITNFDSELHSSDLTFIYTQSLTDNYILSPNLGIGICSDKGNFYLKKEDVNENFLRFLASDNKKVFYNIKMLMTTLNVENINGFDFDSYLALSLIDPENYKKDVSSNLMSFGYFDIKSFEEVYSSKRTPKIPSDLEKMYKDIITKVYGLSKTYSLIKEKLDGEKLSNILYDIEMPLSMALSKIERNGIYIDDKALDELQVYYEKKVSSLLNDLKAYTNINVNSSKQLSNLLFEEWNLPKKGIKKTASGFSTDVENLEKLIVLLEDNHPTQKDFINKLLEYRKESKILSTYVLNLKRHILSDGRIHPINHQLLTETGRLSVMDPNIQNIPAYGEDAYKLRGLFKGEDDREILALDYSQIELRVMASFSGDNNMVDAFNNDMDIHSETAKKMFNITEVSDEKRRAAKAINFGIIYGMSPYGLAKNIGISNDEAKEFINKYFEEYPGVFTFMESKKDEAFNKGHVRTMLGRKRNIENINSKNFKEIEHAKRVSINTPIQGTAADIMKLALINVDHQIKKAKLKSKVIMQIHDEIVLEIYPGEKEKLISLVSDVMENVISLPIKLKVDYNTGKSWAEAK